MKRFLFTLSFILIASNIIAIEYFPGFYYDTIFSQNNTFALVGELVKNKTNEEEVENDYRSNTYLKTNVKLFINNEGYFKEAMNFEIATEMFYCDGNNCRMYITNDGRYVIKEVQSLAPFPGETLFFVNWLVYKIEKNEIVECKPSNVYIYSFSLNNAISLYPNQWLQFMRDYSKQILCSNEVDVFLAVNVNDNLNIRIKYYSIKEQRYLEKDLTVLLDNLCFEINIE